ncbi:MAG: hypothetical protein AAGH74_15290 [Pseudomonadota bacterium]
MSDKSKLSAEELAQADLDSVEAGASKQIKAVEAKGLTASETEAEDAKSVKGSRWNVFTADIFNEPH